MTAKNTMKSKLGRYGTPESRWAGIGPYYAMFPGKFADDVVQSYTKQGEGVLDPFAGRGTAIYSAAKQGRPALGIECNPLGYVYANAKLSPAPQKNVEARLHEISANADKYWASAWNMPKFFRICYTNKVLRFLLAARTELAWKTKSADRTLMAMLMVVLHGKRESSLSNQMRQTAAMSPQYSIEWWKSRGLRPPCIDPVEFMTARIKWRYAKGLPDNERSSVKLGDSVQKLLYIRREVESGHRNRFQLLLTSPPYLNVTNYYTDQWLRLWLLGYPEKPQISEQNEHLGGKFTNQERYVDLLQKVFQRASLVLEPNATVWVRTDKRPRTLEPTIKVLKEVFPNKKMREKRHPVKQIHKHNMKPYSRGGAPLRTSSEVDLILTA